MADLLEDGMTLAEHQQENTGSDGETGIPALLRMAGKDPGGGQGKSGVLGTLGGLIAGAFFPGVAGSTLGVGGSVFGKIAGTIFGGKESLEKDLEEGASGSRLSTEGRNVLREIIRIEASGQGGNDLPRVVLSSILFEREMTQLLAVRIAAVTEEILRETKKARPKFRSEVLESWAAGKTEPTLAIIVMLMNGVRWALANRNEAVRAHLLGIFDESYLDLVSRRSLAQAVDRVREEFRNPTLHGRKTTFTPEEGSCLVTLIVGYPEFTHWLHAAPGRISAEEAVLQSHLLLARGPMAGAS